jgi:hypothetical protein
MFIAANERESSLPQERDVTACETSTSRSAGAPTVRSRKAINILLLWSTRSVLLKKSTFCAKTFSALLFSIERGSKNETQNALVVNQRSVLFRNAMRFNPAFVLESTQLLADRGQEYRGRGGSRTFAIALPR